MTLFEHQARRLASQAAWEVRTVAKALGSCFLLPLACCLVIAFVEIV